jgi:hypothetical protein
LPGYVFIRGRPLFPSRHGFFFGHFPCFRSSGCFFNGFRQICFFEPASTWFFSTGFGFFSGTFFDGAFDTADDLSSGDQMQLDAAANLMVPPVTGEPETSSEDQSPSNQASASTRSPVARGLFVLILKNGTTWAVKDYWLDQGYIEFVSDDNTRSHVPLDSVDVQKTVTENSARGLPFTLRSAAQESH